MSATVLLPRSLVSLIPGTPRRCEVEATTVAEAIDRRSTRARRGFATGWSTAGPPIREHINVFVDGVQADLGTPLRDGAPIHVIPAVSGGAAE